MVSFSLLFVFLSLLDLLGLRSLGQIVDLVEDLLRQLLDHRVVDLAVVGELGLQGLNGSRKLVPVLLGLVVRRNLGGRGEQVAVDLVGDVLELRQLLALLVVEVDLRRRLCKRRLKLVQLGLCLRNQLAEEYQLVVGPGNVPGKIEAEAELAPLPHLEDQHRCGLLLAECLQHGLQHIAVVDLILLRLRLAQVLHRACHFLTLSLSACLLWMIVGVA